MPRVRRRPRGVRELTEPQWWELTIGPHADDDRAFAPDAPPHEKSAFSSDAERKAAWRHWGPAIMADLEQRRAMPGFRPWAWWRYDSGLGDCPIGEDKVAVLRRLGALKEWEEQALAHYAALARSLPLLPPAEQLDSTRNEEDDPHEVE